LDEELHREVALKVMRPQRALEPEARRRFLQEAEITSHLEHPGIVPVYGLMEDGEYGPCYAMRFIAGETLHEGIRHFHLAPRGHEGQERCLGLHALLGRFVAVCNTIAYAHSRSVLHRDLKPANILLGRYGETLVVDWGSAKSLQDKTPTLQDVGTTPDIVLPPADPYATLPGKLLGTPAFMSSEQAAGKWEEVGVASDIFGLGATLYAILTGHAPFEGGPMREVLERARRGTFPLPRQRKHDVPSALEAVCLKAMAPAPEDRYSSALALADDIEHFLAGEPVSVYRESLLARVRRLARRLGNWWRR
jgi:serine/threonine protein kinase